MNLTGSSQIAQLSPDGKEVARFPDPVANQANSPPLDGPIDVAYHGNSLLVANSAYVSNSSSSWALIDVFVGEPGISTAVHPDIPGPAPKPLELSVSPTRVAVGKRVRLRFRVTSIGLAVGGAQVRFGRIHRRSDAHGRASALVVIRRRGAHRVTARKPGYDPAHATFRAR